MRDEPARRRPLSRRKKILWTCLVVPVLLALVLGALELLGWCLLEAKLAEAVEESFYLNHVWRKDRVFTHPEFAEHNPDFPEPYRVLTNGQGFVEEEDTQREKPPGTWRIFYLGDSFTEGTAPMDQNVPGLVEQALNQLSRERRKGIRFEVVNAGTISYSPLLMYVQLRHVVLDYSPDLVVIQVDMTDDFDDWKYRQTAIHDEHGDPWAVPPRNPYEAGYFDSAQGTLQASAWTRLQLWLALHSHFYAWLLQPGAPVPAKGPPVNTDTVYQRWSWCQHAWDEHTVRNVGKSMETIERIAALCKRHGVKLMVTGVPHFPQYAATPQGGGPPLWSDRPHRVLGETAQKAGVAWLNSFEALAPQIRGTVYSVYYYNRDIHMNPRGYRIWAAAQLAFLLDARHGLLPEGFYR